jgi:integrase
VYDKKLKRGKDGLFTRYVGQSRKGLPEKFRLGYDLEAAEQKILLIAALWKGIEEFTPKEFRPFWDRNSLEAAKAIAKGEPPKLPKRDFEDPVKYVQRVSQISKVTGTPFEPEDPTSHQVGLEDIRRQIGLARQQLTSASAVKKAIGVTVRQAITTYEAHVRRSLTLPDGHLRPWGRTKLDQMDSIRNYLSDVRIGGRDFLALDLAELSYGICDEMYGVFRRRPLTLRSNLQKRMAPSSAKNLIKELGNFFDWLDGAEAFDWTSPRRFHAIKKTPHDLTAPEQYDRRLAREKLVIADDQLRVLFEYSLPIERLLLLLGLNCAFAASEIGQLRRGFLKLDRSTIEGIRFKSGNDTRHWLWPQTRVGLEWILDQRGHVKASRPDDQDIVFLTERGKPIWHGTKKGHVSDGVSNIWYRLTRRVLKDHPEFPSYSFNKLRKTSATRILEIADAETASMILAHKTIGEDELLHHYALLPWEKLYEAQRRLGEQLAAVMEAGGHDPWAGKTKSYIGLARTKRVAELHDAGEPAPAIAGQLGISVATVYRLLQPKKKQVKGGTRSPRQDTTGDDRSFASPSPDSDPGAAEEGLPDR